MGTRLNVFISGLFISLFTPQAIASEKEITSSLIFSGGRSIALNSCESPWVTLVDSGYECSESNKIFRIAFNYKFTPAWGVEISGGDLGDARVNGTTSGNPYSWQMKADGWTVAGIGHLAFSKNFSLFGKLGVVRTQLREQIGITVAGVAYYGASYNGVPTTGMEMNAPTYGVGMQYNFSEKTGLRLQYENFGQYDVYSAYGVSTPQRISISAVSAGLVVSY